MADGAYGKPNVVFILADNVGYGDLGCWPMIEALTEVEKYYQTWKDHPTRPRRTSRDFTALEAVELW